MKISILSIRFPSSLALAAALVLGIAGTDARAQVKQNYLQWFETEWDDIERRVPDFFLAGYDAVWLPPVSKASFHSPGYDPFNRFDVGQPPLLTFSSSRDRTSYGTEMTFRAMIQEIQRSGGEVYIDAIFNHNGGRTESDAFLAQGGYPGFWIPREDPPRDKQPTDDWGDFHNGIASGYFQSENPGGPRYDLHRGDLVALVDIAQESTNEFIRQPVEEGNPQNIPAGTVWNRPDADNARFYPDEGLSPDIFVNPGTSRNPGAQSFTRFPYNTTDPMAGDPIADNATGSLMRWAQWMVEVQGVDGFRLDASKHIPSWFWDGFFDSAIHKSRVSPATGNKVTPFTFGENVTGNFDMLSNYIRKDSFANRDALDLQGAARLRDLLGGGGLGSWADINGNADSGHLDFADDGIINGSMGVNHVFSHDNGTTGSGNSMPGFPSARQQGYPMMAYMLMRPGRTIVYHNGRQIPRSSGFYPREGHPAALGWDPVTQELDDTITSLVRLRGQVAYGQYFQLNGNLSDVLVFERAFNNRANCLVAVNDRFDAGTQSVTVSTRYPQGTRLHEMTGNAADPVVDPGNAIPETIIVGPSGSVTLTVPNNRTGTTEHGKGYVVYAEALPEAEVTFIGADGTIDPDPANFPDFLQRLNEATVINDDSFEIRVQTAAGDPDDPNTDDNALFAFDQRNEDYNGNGAPDISTTASVIGGYENFLTLNAPMYDSGNSFGLYRQQIDATQMEEGYHYLSVIVFRHRDPGTTPIFREVRKVVYIDREPPAIELAQAGMVFEDDRPEFTVNLLDRTAKEVYMFLNLGAGEDPLTMLDSSSQVIPYDRFTYIKLLDDALEPGENTVTVVAIEDSGNTNVLTETVTLGAACPADFTGDGVLNFFDISGFLGAFSSGDPDADFNGDGQFNFFDISGFLSAFSAGCP
ncbi:MAG: GC-type dockerin domain-anchored protein [Phycisphaerales bacterium]